MVLVTESEITGEPYSLLKRFEKYPWYDVQSRFWGTCSRADRLRAGSYSGKPHGYRFYTSSSGKSTERDDWNQKMKSFTCRLNAPLKKTEKSAMKCSRFYVFHQFNVVLRYFKRNSLFLQSKNLKNSLYGNYTHRTHWHCC